MLSLQDSAGAQCFSAALWDGQPLYCASYGVHTLLLCTLPPRWQEIIELSCVIVDTAVCVVRPGGWQRYVKPDQHPVLTAFCTELTGITQAQ